MGDTNHRESNPMTDQVTDLVTEQARLDAAGVTHPRADDAARIVSLVPSITELLFALNLADRVVGRTTFCIHPAEALATIPRVGGTKTLRLDRLEALAPTHVIVNIDENRVEDVDAMRRFVPNIIVTHPIEPGDNVALFQLIGAIFDRKQHSDRLVQSFEEELAKTRQAAARLPHRKVLYLIWRDPWMTISAATYISRMLTLVNWHTVASDREIRYPEVDLNLAGNDAELVLLSSEPFPFKAQHQEEIASALGEQRASDIHLVDGEFVSWYGSRAVEGLRYLRNFAKGVAEKTGRNCG
ncbi:MAG: ABC-type Fe3+-hydroxamate transport system substrate-binding protein [Gammaproteobacteria bacterium]